MKHTDYRLLLYVIILTLACLCSCNSPVNNLNTVIVEGDEMPGIGGTREKPDSAVLWYDNQDKKIHIMYLERYRMMKQFEEIQNAENNY